MELQLILNDLSLTASARDRVHGRACMATLISTMVLATRYGARRILRVPRGFESQLICDEYPLAAWRNDAEVSLEQKQFFNVVASKVSYLEGLPHLEQQLISNENRYEGALASGLGVASALEGLAVSVNFQDRWNHSMLDVERRWIELDGDGDVLSAAENVYHASAIAHVETHRDWIRARSQSWASEGIEIWHRRNELLPGLMFCARVEQELGALSPGHVMLKPVYCRLRELDNYGRNWTDGPFDPAQLPSRVSPESQSTIDEHGNELTFLCPDGQNRLFSWHARMTPGEWRLHFYPDGHTRRIMIGRIARKPFV